jgi:cytoskeleton protein RodZ
MTNETVSPADAAASEQNDMPTTTAGAILRSYRSDLGLGIDALASAMRVPVVKLQALEDDRLDALPDAMFARALALAVCRQLKTDASPVLALLPSQDVSRLAPKDERGLDFPLHRPSLLPESSLLVVRAWFTPMRLTALAVLALALFIAAGPDVSLGTSGSQPAVSQTTIEPVMPSVTVVQPVEAPIDAASAPVELPVVSGKMVLTPVQSSAIPLPVAPVTPAAPPASGTGVSNGR